MARSSAERQREYRQRRATAGDNGDRRLSMWVSTGTSLALQRLARHRGVTQRQVLEELVAQADTEATVGMDDAALDRYLSAPAGVRP